MQGGGAVSTIGAVVLIAGSLSWAIGSLFTKQAPPATTSINGSGTQMFAGGRGWTSRSSPNDRYSDFSISWGSGR